MKTKIVFLITPKGPKAFQLDGIYLTPVDPLESLRPVKRRRSAGPRNEGKGPRPDKATRKTKSLNGSGVQKSI